MCSAVSEKSRVGSVSCRVCSPPSTVSSRQRSKPSPAQNASSTEDCRLDHEPCFATSWLLNTNLHMPTLDPVTLLSIVHSPPPASIL